MWKEKLIYIKKLKDKNNIEEIILKLRRKKQINYLSQARLQSLLLVVVDFLVGRPEHFH